MTATREHYRQRRISEAIRRFEPLRIADDKHAVRDTETGCMVDGAVYEDPELARTKCRMLAAAEIERLYLPDEPTALARIQTIIGEQSDRAWAAKMIFELFQGVKR